MSVRKRAYTTACNKDIYLCILYVCISPKISWAGIQFTLHPNEVQFSAMKSLECETILAMCCY